MVGKVKPQPVESKHVFELNKLSWHGKKDTKENCKRAKDDFPKEHQQLNSPRFRVWTPNTVEDPAVSNCRRPYLLPEGRDMVVVPTPMQIN